MANININDIKDLRPAGSEFFGDNESYMSELTEDTISGLKVWGGSLLGELTGALSGELSGEITGLTGALSGEVTGLV